MLSASSLLPRVVFEALPNAKSYAFLALAFTFWLQIPRSFCKNDGLIHPKRSPTSPLTMFSENYAGIWHRDASVRIETLRNSGLDATLRLELVGELWAPVVEPHDRDDLLRLALP